MTVVHTGVEDLAGLVAQGDVVVAAAGRAGLITPDMIKPGAAVVGAGTSWEGKKLLSDVDHGRGRSGRMDDAAHRWGGTDDPGHASAQCGSGRRTILVSADCDRVRLENDAKLENDLKKERHLMQPDRRNRSLSMMTVGISLCVALGVLGVFGLLGVPAGSGILGAPVPAGAQPADSTTTTAVVPTTTTVPPPPPPPRPRPPRRRLRPRPQPAVRPGPLRPRARPRPRPSLP